jgi:hypothetical protein
MAVNLSPVGGVAAQFFTSTGAVLTGGKLYTYAAGTTTPATAYTSSDGLTAWTNPIVLNAAGRVSGGGEIWITDGILYKFVLTDANDVLIATYDNVSGINSNFISFTNQQQLVTATAGQTVFNLSINYQPGTNSLSVFVDGVNQYGPGAQYAYTETDSDTVTFTNGLHVGAEVKFTTTQQQGAGAVNASQVAYDPAGTGAVATNVQTKLRESVSVMDFGATGNGSTDDTAAIQAALNANTIVFFPQGNYLTSGITLNQNQKIYGFGSSLTLSTTTGTLIQCYNSADPLQTNQYSEVNGFVLTGGQTLTSGSVGLSCGLSSRLILRDIRAENFDVGFKIPGSQFGSAYSIKAYACNVGLYLKPSLAGGGANSWSFYDYQGVGNFISAVLINNQSIYPNHSIYFYNPSLLGNPGNTFAIFNATASMYGGAPEGNRSTSGTLTFDGLSIPYSSVYAYNSRLALIDHVNQEGSGASPITSYLAAAQNSVIDVNGIDGYGVTLLGKLITCDQTSRVSISGNVSTATVLDNVSFNGTISNAGAFGTVFVAQDNTYNTSALPNEATSPLTSSLSNVNGSTTSTVGWDSVQGKVGIVTFNAAGTQDTNRVRFSSITSATNAIIGISLKSNVTTEIKFGVYGAAVQGSQKTIKLYANQWVRVYHVISNASVTAGSFYVMYSADGVVASISVTKLMIASSATQTSKMWQDFNAIMNGAYNPLIGAVNYSRSDSVIPTTGTWAKGDVVYNSDPDSGEYIGWVCTVAGTPGTWKTFGLIS